MRVNRAGKFKDHELNEIEKILREHLEELLKVWRKEEEKRDNS